MMTGMFEYFKNKTKGQYYGYHLNNFNVSSTFLNSLSKNNNYYYYYYSNVKINKIITVVLAFCFILSV